jgi:hypothetical protein
MTIIATPEVTAQAAPEERPVRFAALRGKVPLPWVTVVVLAVLMAAVDVFIVTSLQGAVGAIERAQGPFETWVRNTTLLLPLFLLAVIWAFSRAHRKHGLTTKALAKPRRLLTTGLLIVAVGSVVGIGLTVVSAAVDYHLQSNLLQSTAGLHDHGIGANAAADPAYANGGWSPDQRQTMALDVKAVGYGSGLIVICNLVVVGWVIALRGGRLNVIAARRRRTSSTAVSPATA